jgi:LPXTG-motif cell wall-anchored protein
VASAKLVNDFAAMNKYKRVRIGGSLLFHVPVLMTGDETIEALAILALAVGIAGIAILILFSRKKI